LLAVTFADQYHGWICGNNGTILHTTNSGDTWALQSSYVTDWLFAIDFTDSLNGWVTGEPNGGGSVILHTSNGGITWEQQDHPAISGLYGVEFASPLTGWVIDAHGRILHTIDGGALWSFQSSTTTEELRGITFVDALTGWIVGDHGTILHTTDGGLDWIPQASATGNPLKGVAFTNHLTGWIVGDGGVIEHTTDGGENWAVESTLQPVWENLYHVAFQGSSNGWAVGYNGVIVHYGQTIGDTILSSVSGHVTLIGQSADVTQVSIRADSSGGRTTNPLPDGTYLLDSLSVGPHMLIASLPSFWADTAVVDVPAEGLTNVDFALNWRCELAGSLRGTIGGSDTCFVVDNIQVDAGDTLVIRPGTTLMFDGYYRLYVYGLLRAVGTETNAISFTCDTSINEQKWSGILLESASDSSLLEHCFVSRVRNNSNDPTGPYGSLTIRQCSPTFRSVRIEYGEAVGGQNAVGGIRLLNSQAYFSRCAIRLNSGTNIGAVMCSGSSPTFVDCVIEGNDGGLSYGGFYFRSSNPTLQRCTITSNIAGFCGGIGFSACFGATISECEVSQNSGIGVSYSGGGLQLESSVIRDNIIGLEIANSGPFAWGDCAVTNCTIVENAGMGVWLHQSSYRSKVSNCVIANSYYDPNWGAGVGLMSDDSSRCEIRHDCFDSNPGGHLGGSLPSGVWSISTRNANGDSCDAYYNIFMDPMFVDTATGDYHLQAGSPCVDAGDPSLPCDSDNTVSDIGAFYFSHSPTLDSVDDLVIRTSGNNVGLNWSPSRYSGCDSVGISYLIFHQTAVNGEYLFLDATTDTAFVHSNVVHFNPVMFYRVIATTNSRSELSRVTPGMTRSQVESILAGR
jgi:photosystem II stability/assembly factor-like uncharacterized protein